MSDRDPIREARQQWVDHGWGEAADGMAMVTSLVRAHQLLMERVEGALRPHGLTFARYEVLRLLSFTRSGRMPMTRLGSLLQVHPTSVTSAVERLVKQGYVERLRRDDDRRVILAAITREGRDVVEAATASLNAQVFTAPGVSRDDVLGLTELLGRLRSASGDTVITTP
ncbi:MarR family transcriptional regulator [Nocardioides rotundus]|uniref:MarR family winged helix-turn-helix transcriptional regulator n=1 Tax=Nocardioides rotundus TaxID=1774216 RepID=UPI001CBC418D|nr:MarR family transcriptional regulator [Nocardioides rotundus]UAL29150.1 MarR family transcriptional regulator [Nocardioides rotundus]